MIMRTLYYTIVSEEHLSMAKKEFHFTNVEIYKGEDNSLGIGSYGAVYRAKCDELPCAAKILHPLLFQNSDPGASRILERFEQECSFLNELKHPNIVLYLGVYRDHDSNLPVLLMELLDESLTKFLKRSKSELPFHTQLDICCDVAIALSYLHTNGVIHRDLSSNNILLLAGKRAKISDFGMSKLMSITDIDVHSMVTMCPGTEVYMPPETMKQPPVCTEKLDCFSFGVLVIQVLTGLFPNPGPRTREVSFPDSPTGAIEMPVLETERRNNHIQLVDSANSMLSVAISCLNYNPSQRPTSTELCRSLSAIQATAEYCDSKQMSTTKGGASAIEKVLSENLLLKHDLDMIKEVLDNKEKLLLEKENALKEKDNKLQKFQEQMQIQLAHGDTMLKKDQDLTPLKDLNLIEKCKYNEECGIDTVTREAPNQVLKDQLKEAKQCLDEKDLIISQQKADVRELQQRLHETESNLHHIQQILRRRESEIIDQRKRSVQDSPQVLRRILQDEAAAGVGAFEKNPQIQITSIKDGKAICKMARGSSAVNGSVICFRPAGSSDVYAYDISNKQWSVLQPCPLSGFTLVMVGGVLTAIGVCESDSRDVNILLSYQSTSKGEIKTSDCSQWSEEFPSMLTKRYNPAAACTEHILIVAGGNLESGEKSSVVEVLDIASEKWCVTAELPIPISQASAVICEDSLYLVGGIDNNRKWINLVLTCNIDLLYKSISKKQSSRKATRKLRLSRSFPKTKESEWHLVANLPVGRATCSCLNDKLVAVGGITHSNMLCTRRVYVYNVDGNFWELVGHLSTARSQCLVASQENKAIVVGGWLDNSVMTDDVEMLELCEID